MFALEDNKKRILLLVQCRACLLGAALSVWTERLLFLEGILHLSGVVVVFFLLDFTPVSFPAGFSLAEPQRSSGGKLVA